MALDFKDLPLEGNNGLLDLFKRIPDPRSRFGKRFPLHAMLALLFCGMLCGVTSYTGIDDWAQTLTEEEKAKFGFGKHGAPGGSILQKTMRFLNVQAIEREFTLWFARQEGLKGKWIALDGKTARGSSHGEQKGIHLLSAFLHEEKLVLAQELVGEKTNEIPVAQKMIGGMPNVEAATFTLDALHTQDETATVIVREKKCGLRFRGERKSEDAAWLTSGA
jgi:hypothetical protein